MAFCPYCGNQLPEGAAFCSGCGAPAEKKDNQAQPGYSQNYSEPQRDMNQQYYQQGNQAGMADMVPYREIVTCIILSLITCGIYSLYWFYNVAKDLNTVKSDGNEMSPGAVVLLSLITCGIYGIIWAYKSGEKIDELSSMRGVQSSNTGILYAVLFAFGLAIVDYCLIQNFLNNNFARK